MEAKADSEKNEVFLLQKQRYLLKIKLRLQDEIDELQQTLSDLVSEKEALQQNLLEISSDIASRQKTVDDKT